ncbi:sensor histidine kinase [Streptomyces neyagawaensis]|uniref:sensor histidine kinase n=1 Tax=Streptomyces neyagawaensis TaxID=42238 RepID=UPI000A9BD682|nr:HAMP domain-containing sensor histidine kinase [Streptomyces neyagawaensis]MCL6734672.1 HAMP domain-containing histidine kinase [Streptomyces neyagawaensis]MDE1682165.1 HAMP domain-containing sensor histidine kinase [Streptomyces neyagawaensis]
MSGFTGLGETIKAAGLLATTTPCGQPHPRANRAASEHPQRSARAGSRTVAFWLLATLTTLGTLGALSAHTLAHHLTTRTDSEIERFNRLAFPPSGAAAAWAPDGTPDAASDATSASAPGSAAGAPAAPGGPGAPAATPGSACPFGAASGSGTKGETGTGTGSGSDTGAGSGSGSGSGRETGSNSGAGSGTGTKPRAEANSWAGTPSGADADSQAEAEPGTGTTAGADAESRAADASSGTGTSSGGDPESEADGAESGAAAGVTSVSSSAPSPSGSGRAPTRSSPADGADPDQDPDPAITCRADTAGPATPAARKPAARRAVERPASLTPPFLDENTLVLVLDAHGRVVERYPGSVGLPAFPSLTPGRLKAYAARPGPSGFGEAYRAQVVRVPLAGRTHEGSYVVTARSTVEDRRAVERLVQVETTTAVPLLATVVFGARRLGRRERREQQEAERRLREFMAAAGHELRNPLTTISGYAELARVGDPAFEPMRQEALGRIATEVGRMSTLIDELVLLTRLDLGQPLQLTCVDLAQLCRDAASAARDCHPDHPVRLLLAPGDHTVTGDPLRLHQLVANLLNNARVHTPPGTTTTLGLGTEDGHRVIEVMDDGPGIPRELRARLFEPFVRGEATRAPGSGLGLSIVAAIATAHGGTVFLEPSGDGAWFRVRLPAPL